jgi:prepilin-type N-terminal cleavage/methylation domain-containing protein
MLDRKPWLERILHCVGNRPLQPERSIMSQPHLPQRQSGFTLIEIAIVLVIIGLLLGGILKGQELITSARVRNIIAQLDGTKAAVFGFQDRYRALPGDFNKASTQITGASKDGNGDGQIKDDEVIAVWDHLSHAGFINGTYVFNATEGPTTTPNNPYGARLQLIYDKSYADEVGATERTNLKTGPQIPVAILAEIDRKIDDGNALRGTMRFSAYAAGGIAPTPANCYETTAGATLGEWKAGTGEANCGAAILF